MSIINATNEKAKKQKNEVYSGLATIIDVNAVEPKWTTGLSEEDVATAFDLEIDIMPDNESVGKHTIYIPVTKRVNTYDSANRTEAEIAVDDLTKQGLIANGDISTVLAAKDKKCNVWIYDEVGPKGTFRRARLSSRRQRLSNADVMKKFMLMTANALTAPAAQPAVNPFA